MDPNRVNIILDRLLAAHQMRSSSLETTLQTFLEVSGGVQDLTAEDRAQNPFYNLVNMIQRIEVSRGLRGQITYKVYSSEQPPRKITKDEIDAYKAAAMQT